MKPSSPRTSANRDRPKNPPWRLILCVAVICIAVAAVFWPPRDVQFMVSWDDDVNVANNALLGKDFSNGLLPLILHPYENLYVPATYAAYWAQFKVFGMHPFPFRVVNVLIHAANVALVFLILRKLVKADFLSAAAALWWGLHPLCVEPVAWITGLKDVLSGFFLLLSLFTYILWRERPENRKNWPLFAASFLAFALSCLSKPAAVAFPLALIVYDMVVVRLNWRKLSPLIPFFIFSFLIIMATMSAQKLDKAPPSPFDSAFDHIRIAGDTTLFYAGKLFWPEKLCAIYDRTATQVARSHWSVLSVGIICLSFLGLWYAGKKFFFAAALYVAALAPVSGIVPFLYQRLHSTVADRYVYVSAIAIALILALLIKRVGFPGERGYSSLGKAALVVLLAWSAGLGFLARRQVPVWNNPVTLWQRVVDVEPRLAEGWCSLGVAWGMNGKLDKAIEYCKRSIEIDPGYVKGYSNLGVAYAAPAVKRYDLALENYNKALELNPDYGDAYYNRAVVFFYLHQYDKAWDDLRRCKGLGLDINPAFLENLQRESGRLE